MNKKEINSIDDLFEMLDNYTSGVIWNQFYTERTKPAPFLKNNRLPDKCVVDFIQKYSISRAIEFGCGEGRNAIYLAKQGVTVDAFDLSEVAIQNAKEIALSMQIEKVKFTAGNIFKQKFTDEKYDLAIDSGMFHHLSPHRRLQYRRILTSVIREGGYFILLCFAAEDDGDEVSDYEFYKSRQAGVAFSEERLRHFFEEDFKVISIKKCEEICTSEMIEIPCLYKCLLQKKSK